MPAYPAAPRGDAVDLINGLSIPDPFRTLEDGDSAAVSAWQQAQAKLADAYVSAVDGVANLRERVARNMPEHIGIYDPPGVPRYSCGRWFWIRDPDSDGNAPVVTAADPGDDGVVVFDPDQHLDREGRRPVVSWLSPSPDGSLLALGLCFDGSEANFIRLLDLDTGLVLEDRPSQMLMDSWAGGAQWLPDSRGFFYVGINGAKEDFDLRVYRHDIGLPPRATPEEVPLVTGPCEENLAVFVSADGRWAVVSQNTMRPRPVAIRDLTSEDGAWLPFIAELDKTVAGHVIGDEYVAVTDLDAPRGRLVAIPLDPALAEDPRSWRELVPEGERVLRSVTPIGGLLYVHEYLDTYARVEVFDLQGEPVCEVPLPLEGALTEPIFPLMALVPRGHRDEYVFGMSSLTESWGLYRYRRPGGQVETIREPAIRIDAVVEDHLATAADGTQVAYHVVRRPDAAPDQPLPALIYAYGGFNIACVPMFPGPMACLVEAGGLFVHAHIRGGAEFGSAWWEGGRLATKQNCYADLYAVAEDLINQKRTASDRLAVMGTSNGGLMCGVALTQRPELWRAVVPRVPICDLIATRRLPYELSAATLDYGDPEDPVDAQRLLTFSPYHLVRDGGAYPATYLEAGGNDPRCAPGHARKLAARLQEASAGDCPILLRVWDGVGHGGATAKDTEIDVETSWLAFVFQQIGLPARFGDPLPASREAA